MKLFADSRAVIEKSSKIFKCYNKLDRLATGLERIRKIIEPTRSTQTGRKLRAAVLHGPCNLKLDDIPEKEIQQTQVFIKKKNTLLSRSLLINYLNCIIK